MFRRIALIIIASVFLSKTDVGAITLLESIKTALENNKAILSAQKDIEAERSLRSMVLTAYFPRASLRGGYTLWEDLMEIFIKKGEMGEFGGLPIPPEDTIVTFDFTYDYMIQIEAVQPIFAGGRVIFSYLGADENVKSKREEYIRKRDDLIARTVKSFYSVILAKEYQILMEDALRISQDHLKVARARYNAGEVTDYELLRAEVEVANLKPQVIEAKNSYMLALLAFKKTIGVPLQKNVHPEGSLEDIVFRLEGVPNDFLQRAVEARPELKQLKYYESALNYSIKAKIGEYIPAFALTFNYTLQTNTPIGRWYRGGALLLGFEWTIFDGFTRVFEIQRLRSKKESIYFMRKEVEDLVKLEVESTYRKLVASKEMLKASKDTVKSAERGVEIARARYSSGLMTNVEFMDAQLAWERAKLNYLKSTFDYIDAVVSLYRACGMMDEFVENIEREVNYEE